MKTITLTDRQHVALMLAVGSHFDMENDMATDGMFFRVEEIRELAKKSDEEIKSELTRRSQAVNEAIDRVIVLSELVDKLND